MGKQRQPATGYRPAGRQCAECRHAAEDCSRLDFAAMSPAGKRDADGVRRVACSGYVRADEAPCGRATGTCGQATQTCGREGCQVVVRPARFDPVEFDRVLTALFPDAERERQCCGSLMTGPHKMGRSQRTDRAPQFSATRDAGGVVTVCQRPCRCGPDGCTDSWFLGMPHGKVA